MARSLVASLCSIPVSPRTRSAVLAGGVILGAWLGLFACKPKGPSCQPEEVPLEIQLLVSPGQAINPDAAGEPLPTTIRVYQMASAENLDWVDFREVWKNGAKAFSDPVVAEEEFIVYPGRPLERAIKPVDNATHLLVAGIFREPVGNTWYRLYTLPRSHGSAVCEARAAGKELGSPCFMLSVDQSQIEGGPTAPPGFDLGLFPGRKCAPPPEAKSSTPSEAQKRKRKRDRKKPQIDPSAPPSLPSSPAPPAAPQAPAAPAAPTAPAPQAPAAPASPTAAHHGAPEPWALIPRVRG